MNYWELSQREEKLLLSDKYPLTPTITGAEGLEKYVQQMQVDIASNLTWLDYAFGLAHKEIINRDGVEIISPRVYQGKNIDYMPLISTKGTNDFLKSYCFFDAGDIELIFGERAGNYKYARYKVPLAVIFWMNLDRINKDYELTKSKLRSDIIDALSRKLRAQ